MTGPKLFAAASPTKYTQVTDDSKDEDSAGDPTTVLILDRVIAVRNVNHLEVHFVTSRSDDMVGHDFPLLPTFID